MGRARDAGRRAGALRHGAGAGDRTDRHGHGAAPGSDREPVSPFTLEIAIGAVMLAVFAATLAARGTDRRWIAWLATVGVLAVGIVSAFVKPTSPALFGMFTQDGLAIFAKRLFLVAIFFLMMGRTPRSTLFPYTTLF